MKPLHKEMIYSYISRDMRLRIVSLEVLAQIGSSNAYLLNSVTKANEGFRLCFAESQTHGKGRRGGRVWVSPRCGSIYMSVMHACSGTLSAWLSLLAAMEITVALKALGAQGIGIKWPNDICCPTGKIVGVLVEQKANAYVVGVGVNLSLPKDAVDPSQSPAASLEEVLSIRVSRNMLAAIMAESVIKAVDVINSTVDAEQLVTRFHEFDLLYDRMVKVLPDNKSTLSGIASGLSPSAGLRVRHKDGIRIYHSAQISVRL